MLTDYDAPLYGGVNYVESIDEIEDFLKGYGNNTRFTLIPEYYGTHVELIFVEGELRKIIYFGTDARPITLPVLYILDIDTIELDNYPTDPKAFSIDAVLSYHRQIGLSAEYVKELLNKAIYTRSYPEELKGYMKLYLINTMESIYKTEKKSVSIGKTYTPLSREMNKSILQELSNKYKNIGLTESISHLTKRQLLSTLPQLKKKMTIDRSCYGFKIAIIKETGSDYLNNRNRFNQRKENMICYLDRSIVLVN